MTRNHSHGKELPPLAFNPLPQPVVIELDSEAGLIAYQAAVREQDDFPETEPMELP